MRSALHLLLFASLALVGACRNGSTVVDTGKGAEKVPSGQIALLEHEYVNHAWGYQHRGIVVADDGAIISYEWTRGETPWIEPEKADPTAADLDAKYAHGRRVLGTLGADTLELIRRLIPAARRGTLTERESRGADMGQYSRLAWQLDPATGRYTKVTLLVEGDFAWRNTAPEAARLAEIIDAIVARYR